MQSLYSVPPADFATGHSLETSYPLHRCSHCILHPQPTTPYDTRLGSPTPCRYAVVVLYIHSRLGHWTLVGEYDTVHRCSRCILHPPPTKPQDTRRKSLTPCRDAVFVFYSATLLGHRTLIGEVLPRAEMQSMYSTSPAH